MDAIIRVVTLHSVGISGFLIRWLSEFIMQSATSHHSPFHGIIITNGLSQETTNPELIVNGG